MPVAYINIGSNQGDSLTAIERAVALIERLCHCKARRSEFIVSRPWGFKSNNRFLNLGLAIPWNRDPISLLNILQQIERSISPLPHRDNKGNYVDRVIDIDIIALDNTTLNTPRLTLPHPRMHLRMFVLVPMRQIAPDWRHPILKMTPEELISVLEC
ncbi:MAG: 2-amino-4-hydroxy-6-hydroxymethyldihydropteridine diphosphokinase [Muribaculum sp.]|nr:2-amino-4-hydroxy-6-hydroxymethyldihydropteridine diphosphokinase [Muribaculum sp.]